MSLKAECFSIRKPIILASPVALFTIGLETGFIKHATACFPLNNENTHRRWMKLHDARHHGSPNKQRRVKNK